MARKKTNVEFKPSILPRDQSKPFRLNARHCFLTYPHYRCEKKELFEFIDNKYKIKKAVIAEETHEDGNKHMHAYIMFDKKIDIRSCDVFDINDHHCNIQAARKPIACIIYLDKEDKDAFRYGSFEELEEVEDLFELAEETPERIYWEICRKRKVSIRPKIDQSDIRRNSNENSNERCSGYTHNYRAIGSIWDDYLRKTAAAAYTRGYDVTMDQRTDRSWEDNLGTDLLHQTCTIRSTQGYTLTIQKWIPQDDYLRRHGLLEGETRSATPNSGSLSQLSDRCEIPCGQHSANGSPNIFEQRLNLQLG